MNHPALLVSGTETVLVVSLQGQRPLEQVFLNAALVFALLLALPVSYTHLDVYKRQTARRS